MPTACRLVSAETERKALEAWRSRVYENEKLTGNQFALEFALASRDAVSSHQETRELVIALYLNGQLDEPLFPKPKPQLVKATHG